MNNTVGPCSSSSLKKIPSLPSFSESLENISEGKMIIFFRKLPTTFQIYSSCLCVKSKTQFLTASNALEVLGITLMAQ